jgi:hypothetical protein
VRALWGKPLYRMSDTQLTAILRLEDRLEALKERL